MKVSLETARRFVESADVGVGRGEADVKAGSTLAAGFDAAKAQATVVGSDVVAFVPGVTAEARDAIVNGALLAQLVAKKKVPNADNADAWYDAYFDTLTNVGWVIQERQFAVYQEDDTGLDVHKAVLTVLATVLGPAASALAIATSAITALQSMNEDQPFIALFNRESRLGKVGRFQITTVEPSDDKKGFLISLMAFSMTATASLTQVLFVRVKKGVVTLRNTQSKVTIASDIALGALPALKQKLASHVGDFVSMVDI